MLEGKRPQRAAAGNAVLLAVHQGAQLAELVTFWCPPATEEAPEAEVEVTVLEGQPYGHVPGGRIH